MPTSVPAVTYPEHEKMAALRDQIDVVTDFLEWLSGSNYLVVRAYTSSTGTVQLTNRLDECDWPGIERLLSEHFDIDPDRLAAEKDAMLAALRERQP